MPDGLTPDELELLVSVALPAAVAAAMLGWAGWRALAVRFARRRRTYRIEHPESAAEWQAAIATEEPQIEPTPWLKLGGDLVGGLALGAIAFHASEGWHFFAAGGVVVLLGMAWERFLKRYFSDQLPEQQEPDEDMRFFAFIVIGALLMFGALAALT